MRDGRQILVRGEQEANVTHEIDPVVRKVIGKLAARSTIGMSKYGVGLSRPDYSLKDWLTEIQEEALDTANYAEAALEALERPAPAPATGDANKLLTAWQEWHQYLTPDEINEMPCPSLFMEIEREAAALASLAGAGTPEPDELRAIGKRVGDAVLRAEATLPGRTLYELRLIAAELQGYPPYMPHPPAGAVPQAGAHTPDEYLKMEKMPGGDYPVCEECRRPIGAGEFYLPYLVRPTNAPPDWSVAHAQCPPAPAPTVTPAATETVTEKLEQAIEWLKVERTDLCVKVTEPGAVEKAIECIRAAAEAWAAQQPQKGMIAVEMPLSLAKTFASNSPSPSGYDRSTDLLASACRKALAAAQQQEAHP